MTEILYCKKEGHSTLGRRFKLHNVTCLNRKVANGAKTIFKPESTTEDFKDSQYEAHLQHILLLLCYFHIA